MQPHHAADPASNVPTHDSTPLIDRQFTDELIGAVGLDAFFAILETFYPVSEELLHALAAAVAQEDGGSRREAAHSLKGASANIGASRAAAICLALETCDDSEAPSHMRELNEAIPATLAAFQALGN